MVYAVIDTNIFVSSFITKNQTASTRRVVYSMFDGRIKPLYNDDILREYSEVLHRSKFHLTNKDIEQLIEFIKQNGIDAERFPYDGDMPDEDDGVFYEVALNEEDSFLVTGNLKHFPHTPKVITAAQMMEILDSDF